MPLPTIREQALQGQQRTQSNLLDQIRASLEPQMGRLDLSRNVFDYFKTQFGQTPGQTAVPSQFGEAVSLFRPGGQFGAGGRAEVRRGAQQALASGQIAATGTGMSSGTNIAGLRARVAADEALAKKKIEDQRIAQLSSTLQTAGQAGIETQRLSAIQRDSLLRTLASFG